MLEDDLNRIAVVVCYRTNSSIANAPVKPELVTQMAVMVMPRGPKEILKKKSRGKVE